MLMALTREISPAFQDCELTHLDRVSIDLDRARAQHAAYEWALVEAGCTVRRLDTAPDLPDSVFIEDVAVMLPEGAVMTRPGAESRRAERPGVAAALARHGLPLHEIDEPATLDGGDVLVMGRDIFIGESGRTNRAAIDQMRRLLKRRYRIHPVPIDGCLHLKSAVTAVSDDTLLVNRRWVSGTIFKDFTLIDIDDDEPYAANALRLPDRVIYPAAFPRTRERLTRSGITVRTVDVSEIAIAEGAVTCCSLIFEI
jgi:dimethylargininase